MPLSPSSIKRAIDASGNDIKSFLDAQSKHIQALALVDDSSNQLGIVKNPIQVELVPSNKASFDPFGNQRTVFPTSVLDIKQLNDNRPTFYDDQEVSGSGTSSVHNVNTASTVMSVSANTVGKRIRQTFMRANYQTAKSQLIRLTGVLDLSGGGTGITTEILYGDENNALGFRQKDSVTYVLLRSKITGSVVETAVPQTDWNLDKMDGTGLSGETLDVTKGQIFVINFEWLGTGDAVLGLMMDRKLWLIHTFANVNVNNKVFMSTPNLPVRYMIENDGNGGDASLEHICASVISEGGQDNLGELLYESTRGIHINANLSDGTAYAILGLRLKSVGGIGASIKLIGNTLLEKTGSKDFEWFLSFNPTVAGTFTYNDKVNSSVQVAKGNPDGSNIVTNNNQTFAGGFISSSSKGGSSEQELKNARLLGCAIDGTPDTLVLCVRPLDINLDIEASLSWRELT